jgi:predicted short-subunit dehydrogenase-like oxidoreductase (DUF2520 family)
MKTIIIGTGNVAYHLGKRLREKNVQISQVVGRDATKTIWLADSFQATAQIDFNRIDTNADVYILAVSDNAIEKVAARIAPYLAHKFVVHTSGAIPSSVFKPYFQHYGTLYPLQTFSVGSQPDFNKIPVFINTSSPDTYSFYADLLKKLAQYISPNVYNMTDEDRQTLHVAAVFVNNFANHLFKIGAEIVGQKNLPFDILQPLIEETVQKLQRHPPHLMQTGPAQRGDDLTVEKHLDYLSEHTPQYELLYLLHSIRINPNLDINHTKSKK